ncbi:hypothetical protein E2C01_038962 [Portunus trituberculatus]|uniref:Uncharacterized protein n=1 Tax=Portunus trituberculatus TaxID=210409 RepID=A0A5B7FIA6_PORTR|nr:hypothetical protein [Portunus trituberculatus]
MEIKLATRVADLTASLIVKLAQSPTPATPPAKAIVVAKQDPTLFNKRKLAQEAATALTKARITQTILEKGKDTTHLAFSPDPP